MTDKKLDKKKLASTIARCENSGRTPSLRTLRRDLEREALPHPARWQAFEADVTANYAKPETSPSPAPQLAAIVRARPRPNLHREPPPE